MSMATLEKVILASAREVLENPKLKMKDILEWSTADVKSQIGEVVIYVKDPGVYVCVMKDHDMRKGTIT